MVFRYSQPPIRKGGRRLSGHCVTNSFGNVGIDYYVCLYSYYHDFLYIDRCELLMSILWPVLSLVFGALGAILSAVGTWVTRHFRRAKKDTEITVKFPDGTTDEVDVGSDLSPTEVADVVRETLEKDQQPPPASN